MKQIAFITAILSAVNGSAQRTTQKQQTYSKDQVTIVFDAGMGNWSIFFQPVIEQIANAAPVYAIDRKGYKRCDEEQKNRDAITVAIEMHEELEQRGIIGPIILVGHSLGGLNMRMYQHLFPEKVVGMILLDAAHPSLYDNLPGLKENINLQSCKMASIIRIARFGLVNLAKARIPTFGLPVECHKLYYKIVTKAWYYRTYKNELISFEKSLEQCKAIPSLGSLPLLVISSPAGLNAPHDSGKLVKQDYDTVWMHLQRDLANLSTNSVFVQSAGDHFLHLTDTKNVARNILTFYNRLK